MNPTPQYHAADNFSLTYESPRHLRQPSHVSHVSDRSGSGAGDNSYSDLSWTWTGSSHCHSRQSSQLSSLSSHAKHSRQSSQLSNNSYDNRAYERSPYQHHRTADQDHPHHSPTPPMFKLPPHYPKHSPVSLCDQGYHTMVGLQSSPDTSPGASMDLGSLSCPRGVTRPRPPDIPAQVSTGHRNIAASYWSKPLAREGPLSMLEIGRAHV